MEDQPLVSVLMTSYNREKYIAEAIESVLCSSYENWELIICDDASKDNTVTIAQKFTLAEPRIKLFINEENLGDYPNRNKAAGYANGKYIFFLDADDTMYYYCLELCVKFCEQFPEAGFGLGTVPDDNRPCPVFVPPREIYLEHFFKYSHFDRAPGSGFIKREAFNAVGGFSGKRMIGDYEFWFKISRYYSMVKLPFDSYWNRIHEGQESQTEYAKKNYSRLREMVLREALSHPDCPLNNEDLIRINLHLRNNKRKDKILKLLSKGRKIYKKIAHGNLNEML